MCNLDKIDFVVTWVDGDDPEWLKSRAKYCTPDKHDSANGVMRYRDWGLLKYWFRSVEKNCPWVNKVYLITCGQYPEWLDAEHPKLQLVRHSDYMPTDCLPTFNSNSIELLLPTIKSLSNQFVYFNDDMFIVAPTEPSYFFKDGLPCDSFAYDAMKTSGRANVFEHTVLNDSQLIMRHTTKAKLNSILKKHFSLGAGFKNNWHTLVLAGWKYLTGIKNPHQPVSYRKDLCLELLRQEEPTIMKSCHNRFRDSTDLSHWIYRYWQLANDCYRNRPVSDQKVAEIKTDNSAILQKIKRGKYRMVCLNDANDDVDFNVAKKQLAAFFESEYPERSSFERH